MQPLTPCLQYKPFNYLTTLAHLFLIMLISSTTIADTDAPDVRVGYISGIDDAGNSFNDKAVWFENKDGYAIFEGDIILGRTEDLEYSGPPRLLRPNDGGATQGVVITGSSFLRWPNAQVPYLISNQFSTQDRNSIRQRMNNIENISGVRFVDRSFQRDYLHIVPATDPKICGSSFVGRQGGSQQVTIGIGCVDNIAVEHELMHALGFWHEQSRADRNSFVNIIFANIDPDFRFNFDQHISDGQDVGPYDYASIMHYRRTAFSDNGMDTIVPLQSGVTLGGSVLSNNDINSLRQIYGTIAPVSQFSVINEGGSFGSAHWSSNSAANRYELRRDNILIYQGPNTFANVFGQGCSRFTLKACGSLGCSIESVRNSCISGGAPF